MKTISQIQQEVLATAQVTLDELQASIEKFWEQGWERNEEAKRTCQASKWYADNISRAIRSYSSMKNLYEKILSGEYVSQHQSREDAVAEATKQLEKNEESFPRSLNHIYQTAARRTYYSLCGYTHEDEMVHTPGVRYDRQPEYIRNKEIQASGVLSIHFYCESREKFYAKRDQEVRLTIEQATAKLKLQVEKKLTPIKDKIQSFDLISFRGQQGNYVGEWVIRTEDARYIFKTSCILAGGYNIQCLHARYIANLKQVKK